MKPALTILIAMFLTACGPAPDSGPPKPLWQSQLNALNKAKQVNEIVQKQAAEQRRRVDELAR